MRIAILGATGLVGRKMLTLLADERWLTEPPLLLASSRSAGASLSFRGQNLICQQVQADHFAALDLALFSAGRGPSEKWGPVAVAQGVWVVDNSSAWRMASETLLIVPEINGDLLAKSRAKAPCIVANPNCSTIQIAMATAPIDRLFGVREMQVTTMQAVSGAGQSAMKELAAQNGGTPRGADSHFPRPMAHNVVPAVGAIAADGMYEEELKVVQEMRKILARGDDLRISCTATRVPVFNGHSAAVRLVCQKPIDLAAAGDALADWPGLIIDRDPHAFSTPIEMSDRNEVYVGRLRLDPDDPHALLMWVVADNILKGAAWNAVQIARLVAGGD